MLNILTRTHNRESYFKTCRDSISQQTYKDINWIVGSDCECPYYPQAIKLTNTSIKPDYIPNGMYYAPWNTYLNKLQEEVRDGYTMYLDDDDKFIYKNSAEIIANNCEEDKVLIWKVQVLPNWNVPSHSFGLRITAGDFSGIGFAFHSKWLPVDWGCLSYGDYRVAIQLAQKGLKIKWLDAVLTSTQDHPNNGRN